MLDDQFQDLTKQLAVQLTRMAQIQVQLDQIHTMVKKSWTRTTIELGDLSGNAAGSESLPPLAPRPAKSLRPLSITAHVPRGL